MNIDLEHKKKKPKKNDAEKNIPKSVVSYVIKVYNKRYFDKKVERLNQQFNIDNCD